jgi:O-succinylbenzoic acid--CoA ligase
MCLLKDAAERHAEEMAILAAEEFTYARLDAQVSAAADDLVRLSVPGRFARLELRNSPQDVINLLALLRIGETVRLVNPHVPSPCRSAYERLEAGACEILSGMGGATMMFTSGSSGTPKAAIQLYANHAASAQAATENIPVVPGDRWLLSLPLYHVSGTGIVFRCITGGGTIVFPPQGGVAEALRTLNITHLSLVPSQLFRLIKDSENIPWLAKLKAILLGGAPMPELLIERASKLGLPIVTSYGMTETCSQIAATKPGAPVEDLRTAGKPLRPDTISISPDGEILARGDAVFLGYLDAGGISRPATAEGWFPTGDIGKLDVKGRLIITGRRDNRFKYGGEIVQPEEVERALLTVPDVDEAVVVPVTDNEYGAIPVAFIKTRSGKSPDAGDISAALEAILPKYMMPRRYYLYAEHRLDSKPNRQDLAALAESLSQAIG